MSRSARARKAVSSGPTRKEEDSRRVRLVSHCLIEPTRLLHETLHREVIGQDAVIDRIVCAYSRILSGMRDPGRPLLTMLLLGPTGVGKTETAKALARAMFGSERGMVRVNAEEYAHGHEIAKLLGSPPGYVGQEIEPLLSQDRLDQPYADALASGSGAIGRSVGRGDRIERAYSAPVSILLVDEVEKASPKLWNALLGILEDGMLTLGDNRTTDFTHSIILMTSNVGSRAMGEALHRRLVGFEANEPADAAQGEGQLDELAKASAHEVFPAEFLNRFDEILVYRSLRPADLDRIFDKFLSDIEARATRIACTPLRIRASEAARAWMVERGSDPRLGARPLRRVMETQIVDPLSRLIASSQLRPGDEIDIEVEGQRIELYRRARRRSETPSPAPRPSIPASGTQP